MMPSNGIWKTEASTDYRKAVPASFITEEEDWERFKAVCAYKKVKPGQVLGNLMRQYIESIKDNDGLEISGLGNIKKLPEAEHAPLGKPEADILDA